jgi:hypothetical protein
MNGFHQASKKFSEPYIARIAAASEPHLSRARVVLGPYTKPVMSAWTGLVAPTSMYHRQVQPSHGVYANFSYLKALCSYVSELITDNDHTVQFISVS